ncbi:MAG: glycosyltransferase family A protein [Candidatus Omnitrophica bacterium]|nr:glycosyltransferase family A protein [Candidatus Omnitrophota bacterium]
MSVDRNETSPLVGIVIATYNRANLLKRAIEGVLNQTYKNLEIIIVDDGSTDNTEQIVKEYRDLRIQYIRNSKNRGASVARNIGIKSSKGDFIAFLDSDDEYLPEKIEKSLKIFKHCARNLGMVCSNFWKVEGKEKKLGVWKKIKPNYQFPSPSTWVLWKEVFEKIGLFDERLRVEEDREFMFRFHDNFPFYFIDEPLLIRYGTKSSLSSNIEEYVKARKIFLEKHLLSLQKKRGFLARQFYRFAKDLYCIGQKEEARKYFLKAFITYPVKIEYFAKFLGTYFKK